MKRKIQLLVGIMISASSIMAQTTPSQGSGNANSDFWSRSGNIPTTGGNIKITFQNDFNKLPH